MNRMPPMFGQKHLSFVGSPPIISPSWVICLFNHYYLYIILLVIHPMTYSHYIGLLIYHFTEVGKCPTFFTSRNTFKWGIFSPFFFFEKVMWCEIRGSHLGRCTIPFTRPSGAGPDQWRSGAQVFRWCRCPRNHGKSIVVLGASPELEIWRSSHFQHTKFGW